MVGDEREIVSLPEGAERAECSATALSGVPEYSWWYGCSPTSGGMMVGYWDGRPGGYGNLFYGDSSTENADTRDMIASAAHITAGSENGYAYGDWHNSASYPSHESNPDCVADFMKTVDGGTSYLDIPVGLEAYCEWDDPSTPVNESHEATAQVEDVAYWGTPGQAFDYGDLKAEIDSDRPVIVDLMTYLSDLNWHGHSVVAYGYNDDMFQIKVPSPTGEVDVTVGGIAVMDTWLNGTNQSDWYDWSYNIVYPVFDGGHEWWPFVEFQGSSYTYRFDWMVVDAVTLDVEVPEPLTVLVVGSGLLALWSRRNPRP
jgi:hypothetical protein